ncbi:hypothetical protein [Bacillus toyonensis]|uniref:hypothetical protein n=1 Tax=Bacillus toyonensis TaxID=155322 RepID=UPI000BF315A3|nr:hypothetical protein [Bacillus toyonensis]PGC92427.1 hypothetical protein COM39_10430 [Bacillus toyonensis]
MDPQHSINEQNSYNSNAEEIKLADSLKFALLGGLFDILGDALGTYAAKLAIDEALKEQVEQQKTNKKQEEQIKLLQEQIKNLQNQIEKLTK